MTNPSSVIPQSHSAGLVPRSAVLMVACWLLCATLVACAVIAMTGTAQFEQVFSSFGADVPALTMLFLKGRYLWWVLPLAALMLALWVTGKRQHRKSTHTQMTIAFVVLFLASVLLVSVAVFAMYLPIFNIGQPVV